MGLDTSQVDWGFDASMRTSDNKQKIDALEAQLKDLRAMITEAEAQSADTVNHLKQDNHTAVPPPTPVSSTFSVHILHRDYNADWECHPYVMGRLLEFFANFESQGNPVEVVRSVQQAFTMDDPASMVIAIHKDEDLIGHVLCDRGILYLRPIVTVHQYLLDQPITHEARQEIIRLIREWAKYPGPDGKREAADHIQWAVLDKRLARMYQRFFKAKPYALMMRMSVEED